MSFTENAPSIGPRESELVPPTALAVASALLFAIFGVLLVSNVVEFITAIWIVDTVNALAGEEAMGLSDVLGAEVGFAMLYLALIAAVAVGLRKPSRGIRSAAVVVSALAMIGGLVGVIVTLGSNAEYTALREQYDAPELLPLWYVPVSITLSICLCLLGGWSNVKLTDKTVKRWAQSTPR